jgi:WD40 repeat protein
MTEAVKATRDPYVGPRAFDENEQTQFFGRNEEIAILAGLVMARRAVLLFSPSGAGKSSLLRAGLIPELTRPRPVRYGGRAGVSQKMKVLPIATVGRPIAGDAQRPVANLYVFSALLALLPDKTSEELAALTLTQGLAGCFPAAAPEGTPLSELPMEGPGTLLIFDQFEELFTRQQGPSANREDFFRQVCEALEAYPDLHVLFAMREEYIAELTPYMMLLPEQLRPSFRLELLDEEAALEAIQAPARTVQVEFSEAAACKLVNDLRCIKVQGLDGKVVEEEGPWVEPMQLQVVCFSLWEKLPPGTIVIEKFHLESVGDVDAALRSYYAESVRAAAQKSGVSERTIRDWFGHELITEQGVRGQVLQAPERSQGLNNEAIWPFVDAHLVRAERRGERTWFELAHDRLIAPVQADNAEFQAHLRPFQRQAELWAEQGRPDGALLRAQALAEAEAWAAAHDAELSGVDRDFLDECRQARARREQEKRQARRIRWLAVGATVLMLIALAAGVAALLAQQSAVSQRERADRERVTAQAASTVAVKNEATAVSAQSTAVSERDRAEQQTRLASSGRFAALAQQSNAEGYPQRGLLLALEAFKTLAAGDPPVPAAEQALRDGLAGTGGAPLAGHENVVNSAAFSADGRWLATASYDHTARVWDLASADPNAMPRVLRGHTENVESVALSEDGRWLATGSWDTTARVWDLANPDPNAEAAAVFTHTRYVNLVALSSDGRWLLTSSDGENINDTGRVWDLQSGAAGPAELPGGVASAAFGAGGRWLAASMSDGTAWVWDLQASEPFASPWQVPAGSAVYPVAFSPDGHWLITGSADGTARLWDLQSADPAANPREVPGVGSVSSLALSRDGRWLTTASYKGRAGTTEVWDLEAPDTAPKRDVLRGHEDFVTSVQLNADGSQVATTSWDTTARVWDVRAPDPSAEPRALPGHSGSVGSVAFSSDGRWMATGGDDGSAQVWDLQALDADAGPLVLGGHTGMVNSLTFSSDGRWLATGSADGTVRVWDLQANDPNAASQELRGDGSSVNSVAFSPDGRWLAAASDGDTMRLYDLQAADPNSAPRVLPGQKTGVFSVAFSQDGRLLATGSYDGLARVWDLQAPDPSAGPRLLGGGEYWVESVAFSPDGRWLATGSEDQLARVYDLQAPDPNANPRVLRGHEDHVLSVAFSQDGRRLVTQSAGTARLWDLDPAHASEAPVVLPRDLITVTSVSFSPDGSFLATGSDDGTTWLWQMSLDKLLAPACRFAGRNLSSEEWDRYFPGQEYLRTCEELPPGPGTPGGRPILPPPRGSLPGQPWADRALRARDGLSDT